MNLKNLLDSLTLEEKVGQLVQLTASFFDSVTESTQTGPIKDLGLSDTYDMNTTGSILNLTKRDALELMQKKYLEKSRHKIPLVFMTDIIYGYRTVFPIPLAQACSFDYDAIKEAARTVASEAYNDGQHVTFSPMLDLVRDPRWGRVMESFGEDVSVGKKYGQAVVHGFQGSEDGVLREGSLAACVKHFAGYGAPVAGRDYGDVDMSLVQFYNIHLPAYQSAIEAHAKLVMTAFNALNGIPATGNRWLNREVLRGQLCFDGVLITDYGAIRELIDHGVAKDDREAAVLSMEAGVDIDMKTAIYANNIKNLVDQGEIDIALVDEAVYRVLELKDALGLFENPYRGLTKPVKEKSEEEKKQQGIALAEKTSVLLKNTGILPLKKDQKIALIGPYAKSKGIIGMWAFTGAYEKISSLEEAILGSGFVKDLKVSEGSNILMDYSHLGFSDNIGDLSKLFRVQDQVTLENEAYENAKESDVIVLALGESMMESGEGGSKADIHLSKPQVSLIKKLKTLDKPLVLVLYGGRPVILTDIVDDVDAILFAWFPGTYGNHAITNLLFGEANPSGKLSMTFPKHEGQIPIYASTYRSGRPIESEDKHYRFTSRYLDTTNRPLYPFGYGLSYTTFDISDITVDTQKITADTTLDASVTVTNTGSCFGSTVIQLYVKDDVASISRPIRELKQTKRIELRPQESQVVTFTLSKEDLEFVNYELATVAEPGSFRLWIDDSSEVTGEGFMIELV